MGCSYVSIRAAFEGEINCSNPTRSICMPHSLYVKANLKQNMNLLVLSGDSRGYAEQYSSTLNLALLKNTLLIFNYAFSGM